MSYEDDIEKNEYILNLFFERTPDTVIEFKVPTSFREMIMHDADMVMKALPRRTSMEYDFKRKPFSVRDTSVQFVSVLSGEQKTYSHIAFSTVPWKNVAEFNAARKFRDDYWRKSARCMKTVSDYQALAELHDALKALGAKNARYMKGDNGALRRLKRDLCCAFKQGKAGFVHYESVSASNFAALLNIAGFFQLGLEVKRADVEYGAKAAFSENATPTTPDVLLILANIKKVFPHLDQSALLAAPLQDGTQLLPALKEACPFVVRLSKCSPIQPI
jgi:ribulose bisphosphate carboxylase small subunit